MNPRPVAIIPLVFLAACGESAPPPAPQTAAVPTSGPNAADLYRAAFRLFDPDLVRAAAAVTLHPDRTEVVQGTGFRDLDDVSQVLTARQGVIRELIDAARPGACDFGLPAPSEENTPAAIAFCGHLRNAARILNADAARLAEAGDPGGAAERLAAIIGLGAHAADEPWMLVALTDAAIIMLATGSAADLAEAPAPRRLRPEDARLLEAALDRLDPDDPAGLARSAAAESPDARMGSSRDASQTRVKEELRAAREALARVK